MTQKYLEMILHHASRSMRLLVKSDIARDSLVNGFRFSPPPRPSLHVQSFERLRTSLLAHRSRRNTPFCPSPTLANSTVARIRASRLQRGQVELNTIASSFGCMSSLTAGMHRHLLSRFGNEPSRAGQAVRDHASAIGIDAATAAATTGEGGGGGGLGQLIPPNPTLTALPGALAAAHKCYGKPEAVVLFVVQPGETNAVDQRLLEMKLWDDHGVRVVRMSLAEVREGGGGGWVSCINRWMIACFPRS